MMTGNQEMNMPLISVIVPAYNAEPWIKECCESVFAQTYSNWELIVVDDGSKDHTPQILDALALRRENMKVIHTQNGGVCSARNVGLDNARGEFISFLDADDGFTPNALSMLYQRLRSNDADISAGGAAAREAERISDSSGSILRGHEPLIKSLEDHPVGYTVWAKLYKRDVVQDVRFVTGRKVHEDSFFVFQCFMKQPVVAFGNDPVIWRNIHQDSASRENFSEKFFDILYFAEEKVRLIREKYPELEYLLDNLLVKANMALLHNLCKTFDRKYRQAEKQCLRTILEKRDAFRPTIKSDEKWFFIITNHLYYPYKLAWYIRRKLRK